MSQPAGKTRRVPQRTCIVCRQIDAKRELVRLVRTAEGQVVVDTSGKLRGRGAYLCHNPACWEAAIKRRALERALRVEQLSAENQAEITVFAQQLTAAIIERETT